nr:HD domain-containing protein [Desulfobacterales bacterium]
MKTTFIKSIRPGDSVNDVFVVCDKTLYRKKDGTPYISMVLGDKTGYMRAVVWDNAKAIYDSVGVDDYVMVEGDVTEYRDSLQITVRGMHRCDKSQVQRRDFIPSTEKDIEHMMDRLMQVVSAVQNVYLKKLLDAFFNDHEFVERFKTAPAAKKMHHAYIGGLLEHSLSVAILIEAVANHFKGVDRDLLLTAGILHDVGKIFEFHYETHIDYTDAGRLLNHIVIGVELVEKRMSTIKDFPQELSLLLKHMIVSHHGIRDFGSPEPPKTLEAVILNYIDELDSKINGIKGFINGEDSGSSWTSYHRILERRFYKGSSEN